MALLEVENLTVSFPTHDGVVQAVRGISFSVDAGKTLGIVGESGSGKSVATQTIVGLTRGARVTGTATFEGRDLLTMSADELKGVRGAKIAMIFQDPLSSLHPYYKVGWQITEMIHAHEKISKDEAKARAIKLLDMVGIPEPHRRVNEYPHEFSGGMRQRAMIAMALALHPALLVADEPTTALDVTVQAQIIDLMKHLQQEFNIAIIMITHDLGVIADMAHDVLVMYAGKAMETAERRAIYYRTHHPYTAGLLNSLPQHGKEGERLLSIAGQPPSMIGPPSGCPFHPRCSYVMDRCVAEVPPLVEVDEPTHRSACFLATSLVGTSTEVDAARHRAAAAAGGHERVGVASAPASSNPSDRR